MKKLTLMGKDQKQNAVCTAQAQLKKFPSQDSGVSAHQLPHCPSVELN
jgi:hypothetical protein